MEQDQKIRVIDLFAGVGGFKIGLERASDLFQTIWANQWEPSTKKQHAAMVYENRFPDVEHVCKDIGQIRSEDIPDHDMLVGGFPCQDFSVANTRTRGIEGKKGVLWWEIYRIANEKRPSYLLLENVDRLLKSPTSQRGRDFAIMLNTLHSLGYNIEYSVVNGADYGFPQKRRRVYIFAYHNDSKINKTITSPSFIARNSTCSFMDIAFPIESNINVSEVSLNGTPKKISDEFNKGGKISPFKKRGNLPFNDQDDKVLITRDYQPSYNRGCSKLSDILQPDEEVDEEFFIDDSTLEKWEYLKGGKKEERKSDDGHVYTYSEGGMRFPDPIDEPSRTIVTGEGGSSPSRFKHVVQPEGRLRRLTPIELERLNGFPDDHTNIEGMTNTKRAFLMGNALIVGVIQRIGESIDGIYTVS